MKEPSKSEVEYKLLEVYNDLLAHEGFSSFGVNMKILKRGQKEVIIKSGKEFRYVVDFDNTPEITSKAKKVVK